MKRAAINGGSSSDVHSSLIPNIPTTYKNHVQATALSSNDSHSSFESVITLNARSSTLTSAKSEDFRQRIEKEYDGLQTTEAGYRYYINDQSLLKRARSELERAANGTLIF
jgi:hypothetical protein